MESARVVESRSPAHAEGDLVATTYGHRTGHVLDPAAVLVVPLPPALDPLLGVYVAQMGPICANGCCTPPRRTVGAAPGVELGDGVRDRRVLVTAAASSGC
jgi:hypothetical protein